MSRSAEIQPRKSRKQHQARNDRNRGCEHGEARENCMRVDGATAVSLQAPPENGNRDEQGGCENAEPSVKRREWLPAAEEENGYGAREKAHADEHDRGFREAQMGAEQVGCSRLSSESRAPQTQTGSQRERHNPEARDHPQGVHVGVEHEQRVARDGVQSLHLVYRAFW